MLHAVVHVWRDGLLENGELGVVETLPEADEHVDHFDGGRQTRRAALAVAIVLFHVVGKRHQLLGETVTRQR